MLWAHDRFGGYAQAGLLAEVKPSTSFKAKFADFTWDAVSYDGKYIGYPVAVESLSLIYNKDIIKTPPKNWEDIAALDKTLQKKASTPSCGTYLNLSLLGLSLLQMGLCLQI